MCLPSVILSSVDCFALIPWCHSRSLCVCFHLINFRLICGTHLCNSSPLRYAWRGAPLGLHTPHVRVASGQLRCVCIRPALRVGPPRRTVAVTLSQTRVSVSHVSYPFVCVCTERAVSQRFPGNTVRSVHCGSSLYFVHSVCIARHHDCEPLCIHGVPTGRATCRRAAAIRASKSRRSTVCSGAVAQ